MPGLLRETCRSEVTPEGGGSVTIRMQAAGKYQRRRRSCGRTGMQS